MFILQPSSKVRALIRLDIAGAGYFKAPRGDRVHRGVDYSVQKGAKIYAPVDGEVVKAQSGREYDRPSE